MELHPPNRKLLRFNRRNKLLVVLIIIESQWRKELSQSLILTKTVLRHSEHVIEVHNLVFLEVEFHPV
jgi:hypothetical protein